MSRSSLRLSVLASLCAGCMPPGAPNEPKQTSAAGCAQLTHALVEQLVGQPVWFRGSQEKFCHADHAFPAAVYDRADATSPPNLAKLVIKDVRVMPVADDPACAVDPYISVDVTDGDKPLFITAKVGFEFKRTSHDITRETMFAVERAMPCFFGTDPVPAGTSDEDVALLRERKIRIGMSKDLAILALGKPLQTKVRTTAAGESEEATFTHHVVVTFVGGAVAEIEK